MPSLEPELANVHLAAYVKDALSNDDQHHSFRTLICEFGWESGQFCRKVDVVCLATTLKKYRYERIKELGSGSYAVVYKARNRETDEHVAIKKLRFGATEQGIPASTLREICLLKELKHENIVELKEVIMGIPGANIYVVLECLDCDLREYLDTCKEARDYRNIKIYAYQILKAIQYSHLNCVMHRDLKPQNILVDKANNRVKIADFGLARSYLPPQRAYTNKVVTLWYRAPELLLGAAHYSATVDLWSVGCIIAEMMNFEPLFKAESEVGLLHRIFQVLGTPAESCWKGVKDLPFFRSSFPQWHRQDLRQLVPRMAQDPKGLDLLSHMLTYNPEDRITASEALNHPWFADLRGKGILSESTSSETRLEVVL